MCMLINIIFLGNKYVRHTFIRRTPRRVPLQIYLFHLKTFGETIDNKFLFKIAFT